MKWSPFRSRILLHWRNKLSLISCVSFTLEVEFEFTTWAWVQTTAETPFCGGLVVRSPGSVKALNQSTHNSLSHRQNVHSAVAGHSRMNFRPWPAMAEWTFRQWLRELWVDWFNALTEPGDQTTRPLQNAVSAVAWIQTQVVNSNSTLAVQCRGITWIHRSPSRPRPFVRPTAALINIHEHLI